MTGRRTSWLPAIHSTWRSRSTTRATARTSSARPSLHDWLVRWTQAEVTALEQPDSLVGVLHHLSDAWARRERSNVLLVHYADLLSDLEGEMRRVASSLGVGVPDGMWPALVEAATFAQMRSRSDELVSNAMGVLKDVSRFFRQGRSGAGREVLSQVELEAYGERVASLAPSDLIAWLHR